MRISNYHNLDFLTFQSFYFFTDHHPTLLTRMNPKIRIVARILVQFNNTPLWATPTTRDDPTPFTPHMLLTIRTPKL